MNADEGRPAYGGRGFTAEAQRKWIGGFAAGVAPSGRTRVMAVPAANPRHWPVQGRTAQEGAGLTSLVTEPARARGYWYRAELYNKC